MLDIDTKGMRAIRDWLTGKTVEQIRLKDVPDNCLMSRKPLYVLRKTVGCASESDPLYLSCTQNMKAFMFSHDWKGYAHHFESIERAQQFLDKHPILHANHGLVPVKLLVSTIMMLDE